MNEGERGPDFVNVYYTSAPEDKSLCVTIFCTCSCVVVSACALMVLNSLF